MEDKFEQEEFGDMDFDEKQVVKIQAFIKGELVRKWLQEVKDDYEKVFCEIEKSKSVFVEWPDSGFGPPKVRKQRPKLKKKFDEVKLENSVCISPNVDMHRQKQNYEPNSQERMFSPQNSVSGCLPETVYKPISDVQNMSRACKRSEIVEHVHVTSKCAIETQTSLDKDVNIEIDHKSRDITHDKGPVKTYDMLIQTDDTHETELKEQKKNDLESTESVSNHANVNRLLLEQKINRFESQLQSLKQMSQQEPRKETKVKNIETTPITSPRQDRDKNFMVVSPSSNTAGNTFSPSPKRPTSPTVEKEKGPRVPSPRRPSYHQETSVLTNVTSVWDSFNSECKDPSSISYPSDPEALRQMRKSVSMELLWVQQAIDSRKNYLKLKSQMKTTS